MSKINFGESSKCETAHKCQKGGVWCGKSCDSGSECFAEFGVSRHEAPFAVEIETDCALWICKLLFCTFHQHILCLCVFLSIFSVLGVVWRCTNLFIIIIIFCQHCLLLCLHDCTHSFTTTKLFTGFIKALVVLCLQQRISLLNSMVADSQSKPK